MIQHVILFTLRHNTADDKLALVASLDRLLDQVSSIRRFTLADHVSHGQAYSDAPPAYQSCAVFEFDNPAGLDTYLRHPAQIAATRRFNEATVSVLRVDYAVSIDFHLNHRRQNHPADPSCPPPEATRVREGLRRPRRSVKAA
jgi:hypothetical protein